MPQLSNATVLSGVGHIHLKIHWLPLSPHTRPAGYLYPITSQVALLTGGGHIHSKIHWLPLSSHTCPAGHLHPGRQFWFAQAIGASLFLQVRLQAGTQSSNTEPPLQTTPIYDMTS